MRKTIFGLIALGSTNVAMKLEKELLEDGVEVRIIPVPKEITANCGLSVMFPLEEIERVRKRLVEGEVEAKLYKVEKVGLKKKVEEM